MNIGERIYNLRTEADMSQGDLAEKLNVSRQSVSKWENNNSTPDIEKLVLIADVFGITVDELVKDDASSVSLTDNENKAEATHPEEAINQPIAAASAKPQKNIKAAKILLGLGIAVAFGFFIFGLGLTGLIFAIPFLTCSLICYLAKKDVGFACTWVLVFLADMYIRLGTGISWATIRLISQWEPSMNYWRLLIAWVQFAVILSLVVYTIVRARKIVTEITSKFKQELIAYWLGFIIFQGSSSIASYFINKAIIEQQKIPEYLSSLSWVFQLTDWLCIFFFAFAMAKTVVYVKNKRKKAFTN